MYLVSSLESQLATYKRMEQHFQQTLKRNEELQSQVAQSLVQQSAVQQHAPEQVKALEEQVEYLQGKWIKYKSKLKHSEKRVSEENDNLRLLVSQLHHRIEEAEYEKKLLSKDLEWKEREIQKRNRFIQAFIQKSTISAASIDLNTLPFNT